MTKNWDTYFMSMCDLVAMKSKDKWTISGWDNQGRAFTIDPIGYTVTVGDSREHDEFTDEDIANAAIIESAFMLYTALSWLTDEIENPQDPAEPSEEAMVFAFDLIEKIKNRPKEFKFLACDNCGTYYLNDKNLIPPDQIKNLFQRISPGEPMPYGECPKCHALVHMVKAYQKED